MGVSWTSRLCGALVGVLLPAAAIAQADPPPHGDGGPPIRPGYESFLEETARGAGLVCVGREAGCSFDMAIERTTLRIDDGGARIRVGYREAPAGDCLKGPERLWLCPLSSSERDAAYATLVRDRLRGERAAATALASVWGGEGEAADVLSWE